VCGSGDPAWGHPKPPVPPGSSGLEFAPAGWARPAPPSRSRHRSSLGPDRRGGVAAWAPPRRRRPSPTERPPHRAARRRAGSRASAPAPRDPSSRRRRRHDPHDRSRPGAAAARAGSHPRPARRSKIGPALPGTRPTWRSTRLPRRRRARHARGGHDLRGGASSLCRRSRPPRPDPLVRPPCPRRAPSPGALAPLSVRRRALSRGSSGALSSPLHPTDRSGSGRSGGARSPPASRAVRLRSRGPSLLPSLGARGQSGSRASGCSRAPLCDHRSEHRATASAARGTRNHLVQSSSSSGAAPPARRAYRRAPAASRATSTRCLPHRAAPIWLPAR
jgi:hypothetical protein